MNLSTLIQKSLEDFKLNEDSNGIFIGWGKEHYAPDIPDKILKNAEKSTDQLINSDYLIAIFDTSLMLKGKEGIYFTGNRMVLKDSFENPIQILFEDITDVELKEFVEKNETILTLEFILKDGSTYTPKTEFYKSINANALKKILDNILVEENFVEKNQIQPLEILNEDLKLTYLKILSNYVFNTSEDLDSEHYADIMTFIARINLEPKYRLLFRKYLFDNNSRTETTKLIEIIKSNAEENDIEFSVVSISLLTDLIDLYLKRYPNTSTVDDKFILSLSNTLEIKTQVLENLLESKIKEKNILEQRLNDSNIQKVFKDISAKAASIGIPMAALYFSGTAGVSAVGLTSGLATLGFGGVLGLSSMFTGVGVLALLGVTSYHGIKKLTGLDEVKNNSVREVMLQEIIKNNQKSQNYLIEDLNIISDMLIQEITVSDINKKKIEKLTEFLKATAKSSQIVSNRVNHYESENILTRVPKEIKMDTLKELISSNENEEAYFSIIFDAYEIHDDVLYLKKNVSKSIAEKLLNVLDDIGYYKVSNQVTATTVSKAKSLFDNLKGE